MLYGTKFNGPLALSNASCRSPKRRACSAKTGVYDGLRGARDEVLPKASAGRHPEPGAASRLAWTVVVAGGLGLWSISERPTRMARTMVCSGPSLSWIVASMEATDRRGVLTSAPRMTVRTWTGRRWLAGRSNGPGNGRWICPVGETASARPHARGCTKVLLVPNQTNSVRDDGRTPGHSPPVK